MEQGTSRRGVGIVRDRAFVLGVLAMVSSLVSSLGGCHPRPIAPLALEVNARAENGVPVADVEIFESGSLIARTGADGRARLDVRGAEGATYEIEVKCPSGYRSPTEPLSVRRLSLEATRMPEYAVTCHTTRHALVFVVRTEGLPNLPVLHLGSKIGETDRSGVAHVMVEGEAHERIELVLDTSAAKEADKIHPRNPSFALDLPDHDGIEFFDVTFTRDAKPKRRAAAKPSGPVGF